MSFGAAIDGLIQALRVLPGVGPKSAQRMAFFLLERNRAGAAQLVVQLQKALENVRRCDQCRNLTDQPRCAICTDARRDQRLLCIVEAPADVAALEQSGGFRGRYFVLHGRLSPLDGLGPKELGFEHLFAQLTNDLTEVVIATNPTVEGEATAHYLAQECHRRSLPVSRIAHGVPIGGELEYLDGNTLTQAMSARRRV
jgi:recombination protein RecR